MGTKERKRTIYTHISSTLRTLYGFEITSKSILEPALKEWLNFQKLRKYEPEREKEGEKEKERGRKSDW